MVDINQKLAGLLLPTFALRRQGDLGIGDVECMREAVDFCQRNQIGVLQILPINETGGDNSPYNAISSMALDPALMTVDPKGLPHLSAATFEQLAPLGTILELESGPVRYADVKQLKMDVLNAAFDAFEATHLKSGNQQASNFVKFQEDNKEWLPKYTLFRTLMEEHAGNACWPEWSPAVRSYDAAEKWLAQCDHREHLGRYRLFLAYVQWQAFEQWRALKQYADSRGVSLMGDIPFGVSRFSADVWANQELFDLEWSGGAPPEPFFQTDQFTKRWGQNWGIPLYRWDAHEADNYRWWRQRIARLADVFHYFRIDHVLGFFRVYAFPWPPEKNWEFVHLSQEQASALTGGRLPQFMPNADKPEELAAKNLAQGEKILRVLKEAAGSTGLVAEDLGMVPDYVRPLLARLGIPGFSIPTFEREEDRSYTPKEDLPAINLATYATHDHHGIVSFYQDLVHRWHGPDGHEAWLELQRLMTFLGLDPLHPPREFTPELHEAFIRALLETPCWLAVFMVTDVLGTRQRFNEPGKSSDSNWSQRLDHTLAEYEHLAPYFFAIQTLVRLIRQTGRAPGKVFVSR